ncbi:MAG: oligosaccharide flippase family protein [Rhodothermales bacterium]
MSKPADMTRSIATLLTGSVGAMAVAYLAQPILVRLYTPDAFGVLDLFLSALSILIPVASLRYEDAIMLPADDRDARPVVGLSVLLMLITASLCAVAVHLGGAQLVGEALWPSAVWLAPALILIRLGKISELWLTRQKRYGTLSRGQMANALAMTAGRLAGGFRGMGVAGLIGGYLVGNLISAGLWIGASMASLRAPAERLFDRRAMAQAAHRYRRFPTFSMPSTLLNALVTRLPFVLLAVYFDAAVVGYFGRAFALLAVPLSLIGGAVSQVFFVEGAEATRRGTLPALTDVVHRRLVGIGLFPALALVLAGPQLVGFVFGAPWIPAGEYLRILAPWLFLASVASPLTRVFDITERQRLDLASSVAMFTVQTLALLVAGQTRDLELTLWAVGLAGAASRWAHAALIVRTAGVSWRAFVGAYFFWGLRSLPFLAVVALTRNLEPAWAPFLGASLAGAGYLAVLYLVERSGQRMERNVGGRP